MDPLLGNQVQSMWGGEAPRGKKRQPCCARLHGLLGKSLARKQSGRASAMLRGPIWQSHGREASLPWSSLAGTRLAARFPAREGVRCTQMGDSLAPSRPQLRSCLAFAPRP